MRIERTSDEPTGKEAAVLQGIAVLLLLGIVAFGVFGQPVLARTFYDGTVEGAVLLGERLVVGEHVYVRADEDTMVFARLVLLDARTGEERGRATVGTVEACEASGTEGLYCGDGRELHHVAVPSLVVTDLKDAAEAAGHDLDYPGRPSLLADPALPRVYTRAVDGRWLALGPGARVDAVDEPARTRSFAWAQHGSGSGRRGPRELIDSQLVDEGLPPGQSWITYQQSMATGATRWLLVQLDGKEVERIELGFPGSLESVLPWDGGTLACVRHEDGTRVLSVGPDGHLRWQVRL